MPPSDPTEPKPPPTLRSSIPSFVPTSQVVKLRSKVNKFKGMFTTNGTAPDEKHGPESTFTTASTATALFPATQPDIDGEECLHDCESCTVSLPRKWSIDETDQLYGHVKGWDYHVVVATGKSDWVRDIIDEKGSLMESLGVHGLEVQSKRIMLSASNMPVDEPDYDNNGMTNVMLLPQWTYVQGISRNEVPWLVDHIARGPSNLDQLGQTSQPDQPTSIPAGIEVQQLHHKALILMCSHKTRDARCGQSAPLLRRELERHLRPLGLYRDLNDTRPNGVGIYFINHVGGHKYSANVMIYRRAGRDGEESSTAVQGIWLARVRPEDCENIVRYTVLQGKVVKPMRQLRGGFDRSAGVASW